MQLLRKRYGAAVRGEVLESAVQDSSAEAIRERNLRPALPPRGRARLEREGADLEYKMSLGGPAGHAGRRISPSSASNGSWRRCPTRMSTRRSSEWPSSSANRNRSSVRPRAATSSWSTSSAVSATRRSPAAAARTAQIELGAEGLLPGLRGAADRRQRRRAPRRSRVTFPRDYAARRWPARRAVFEVDVKEVRHRLPAAIDDDAGRGGRARKPRRAAPGDPAADAARLRRLAPPAAEARAARQARRTVRFPGPARHGRYGVRRRSGGNTRRSAMRADRSPRGPPRTGAGRAPAAGAGRCRPDRCRQCIAPEETALEGASDRAPATAEAAKPAEHETDAAGHHAIPHPGSSSEPIDAAAIIAPEETALEGASDTEPDAPSDTEDDEKAAASSAGLPSAGCGWGCCLPRSVATTIYTVTQDELNQALAPGSAAASRLRAAGLRFLPHRTPRP